jgi:hypothetical protein
LCVIKGNTLLNKGLQHFINILNFREKSLLGSPSRCALVKHKIGEKYSQAQQLFYNCHRMLVFLRHVSTHFPSHPQALYNSENWM